MIDVQDKIIVIEDVITSYIKNYKLYDHIDDVTEYVDEDFVNEIDAKYETDWCINSRMKCWSILFTDDTIDSLYSEKLSYIGKMVEIFTNRVADSLKVFADELRFFIIDLADNGLEQGTGREIYHKGKTYEKQRNKHQN